MTSNHGSAPRLNNPGLLGSDLIDAIAENMHVVHGDGSNDSDVCMSDVDRVPASAQTHLDDGNVHWCISKGGESHRRHHLKEGHLDTVDALGVNQIHHGFNLTPRLVKKIVADGAAIDADALSDVHQVRRAVTTHPQTSRPQQRVNHNRRRPLAVRTGNLDDGTGLLRVTEQV